MDSASLDEFQGAAVFFTQLDTGHAAGYAAATISSVVRPRDSPRSVTR